MVIGTPTLGERIGSLRRLLHRALTQWLARHDTRPLQQLSALRFVAREEAKNQAELAERLVIDAPATSRLVDRLEADGLLQRLPGVDRRSVGLQVTARATPHIEQLEAGLAWLDAEVRRHLTDDEVRTALSIIEKLHAGFAERR